MKNLNNFTFADINPEDIWNEAKLYAITQVDDFIINKRKDNGDRKIRFIHFECKDDGYQSNFLDFLIKNDIGFSYTTTLSGERVKCLSLRQKHIYVLDEKKVESIAFDKDIRVLEEVCLLSFNKILTKYGFDNYYTR